MSSKTATKAPAPETTAADGSADQETIATSGESTAEATAVPTAEATAIPTAEATAVPTAEATAIPTAEATAEPTAEPTAEATDLPSDAAQGSDGVVGVPIADQVLNIVLTHPDVATAVQGMVQAEVARIGGMDPAALKTIVEGEVAEAMAKRASDDGKAQADPIALQRLAAEAAAEKARKAEERAKRDAEKRAEAERQERIDRQARATENWQALLGTPPALDAPDIVLGDVKSAKMMLSNGSTFSIDFARTVQVADLVATDDGAIASREPAIRIGDDMPEQFQMTQAVLVLEMTEGFEVLTCPISPAMAVGGGIVVQLPAQSLLFKRPR